MTNLHILCQEAVKCNMYEVINLTKQSTVFHTIFYSTIERIAFRLHINCYYHRACKKNIIYNWNQLDFKFSCKWWVSGFCKFWNRSQKDFSHWWSICKNSTFHVTRILMLDLQWRRQRQREREREEITSSRKTSTEKSFEFFWDFVTFLLWNVFLNKTFYPRPRTLPAEKVAKQTLFLTICKNLYKWISIYCRNCFWKKKKKTNIKEIGFYFIMKKHWH